MKWWTAAAIAALVVACAKSDSVTCDDGTACPSGTVCVERTPIHCVLEDQTKVCGSLGEGAYCTGKGFVGICSEGVCLPGCGDGAQDVDGEQCDDGNFASHDGCSSRCLTESPTWNELPGPWRPRARLASAYDAVNGRLVVFGGTTPGGQDGATWTNDAQGWKLIANGPPGLASASLVFDSARSVFVLFGGNDIDGIGTDQTWELSGNQWQKVTPTTSPPRRTMATMFFDTQRNTTILFSGTTDVTPVTELNDTWEYNGTTWTQLSPSTPPPARYASAVAYDPVRHVGVLFGGRSGAGRRSDTWTFASATGQWGQVTLTGGPPPAGRERHAMVYVPAPRDSIMMFGGELPGQNMSNDTWELTGTTWSSIATTVSPPPREEHALVYVNGRLNVIGGSSTELFDDVWQLDPLGAAQWRPVDLGFLPEARTTAIAYDVESEEVVIYGGTPTAIVSPDFWAFGIRGWRRVANALPARGTHGLAYDTAGHRLVAVAGQNATTTLVPTTDVWNGTAWTPISSDLTPLRRNPAFAFDDAGLGVLFGGEDSVAAGIAPFGDTWELNGSTWTKTVPEGGAGPAKQAAAALIYDPTRSVFLLVATDGKTWSYDRASHTWSGLATEKSPPSRSGEQLIYDSVRKKIVMLGGYDPNTFYTNDLWQLDRDEDGVDTWHLLHIVGEPPPPRRETRAAYSQRLRAIVMFGGNEPTRLNDTWLLRFSSTTPDELCIDNVDNDGDLQVDAADPDCE